MRDRASPAVGPKPGPRTATAEQPTGVRSVERALSILEQLAMAGRACSLSELSSSAGLSVGTTHRVVRTLVFRGYVRQLATKAYTLGPSLVELGDSARYGAGLGAEPHLRDLAERAGGTAGLAVLDGPDVVFVAQAVPRNRGLRVVIALGERAPFACAIGDAILAALPLGRTRDRLVADQLRRCDAPDLAVRLQQVRQLGYAVDDGRDSGGVSCLAVGVNRSVVPAAVVLIGAAGNPDEQVSSSAVQLLRSVASELGSEIGYRKTP